MVPRNLALTFAGGGNRSFYQVGLWNRWGARLLPRVAAVAASSAGACVATILLSGRMDGAKAFWKDRRRGVLKNISFRNLLRGAPPAPHAPIYRDTLLYAYRHGGLERIRAQPFPVLVLTTSFPRRVPRALAPVIGWAAYSLETSARKRMIHPTLGRALGFRPQVFDARACETPEELAELIVSSSATPPFTPLGAYSGMRLLDGGVIDNAPAFAADAVPGVEKNLVLLTRPYPTSVLGPRGPRFYLAPRKPLPVDAWDYTRPDMLDATILTGEREALDHAPALDAFLGS